MEESKLVSSGLDAVQTLIEYLGKDAIGSEFLSDFINSRALQAEQNKKQKEVLNNMYESTAQMESSVADIASRAVRNNDRLNDIYKEIATLKESVERIEKEHKAYVEQFRALIQHTTDITSLVDEIQNISEQTNLLSFNASIEAAHAGAAGAGFRIIANEVKKLSDNTKQTSEKIMYNVGLLKNSISDLEVGTKNNTTALSGLSKETDGTLEKFSNVRLMNGQTNEEVKKISESINKNVSQIDGIIKNLTSSEDENQKTVNLFADCASKNQMLFNDLYSFAYEIRAILEDLKKVQ